MYIPEHFREVDPAAVAALIEAAPLACLVAATAGGHVAHPQPQIVAPGGGALIGHMALANDMHRLVAEGQEVLAVFRAEEGYISPNWYPGKAGHHRVVPTWNYRVVHVHGPISFRHDTRSKRAAVGLLTSRRERRTNGAAAWRMADAPADYMEAMLDGIVAFRIGMQRTLAKSKLSQNREPRDRAGAVEGLRAAGGAALAAAMERSRPRPAAGAAPSGSDVRGDWWSQGESNP